jgi:hypothetical protein
MKREIEMNTDYETILEALNEYGRNKGKSPVFLTLLSNTAGKRPNSDPNAEWVMSNKTWGSGHGLVTKSEYEEWKELRKEFGYRDATHGSRVNWSTDCMSNLNKRKKIARLIFDCVCEYP